MPYHFCPFGHQQRQKFFYTFSKESLTSPFNICKYPCNKKVIKIIKQLRKKKKTERDVSTYMNTKELTEKVISIGRFGSKFGENNEIVI